jgi:hypothetical protein
MPTRSHEVRGYVERRSADKFRLRKDVDQRLSEDNSATGTSDVSHRKLSENLRD